VSGSECEDLQLWPAGSSKVPTMHVQNPQGGLVPRPLGRGERDLWPFYSGAGRCKHGGPCLVALYWRPSLRFPRVTTR